MPSIFHISPRENICDEILYFSSQTHFALIFICLKISLTFHRNLGFWVSWSHWMKLLCKSNKYLIWILWLTMLTFCDTKSSMLKRSLNKTPVSLFQCYKILQIHTHLKDLSWGRNCYILTLFLTKWISNKNRDIRIGTDLSAKR